MPRPKISNWLICWCSKPGDVHWDNIQALSAMHAIELLGLKDDQVISVYQQMPRWKNSKAKSA